jgi:hypothetical protein
LLQAAFRRVDGLLQTSVTYLPRENKEELESASSRYELGTGFGCGANRSRGLVLTGFSSNGSCWAFDAPQQHWEFGVGVWSSNGIRVACFSSGFRKAGRKGMGIAVNL